MGLLCYTANEPVAVIGDIHGCAKALDEMLSRLGDLPVIVLGDVADRGPDSKAVIDRLIARKAIGVRGNHDDWLLAWARGEGFDSFALNGIMGGRATLASYGVTGTSRSEIEAERFKVPTAHAAFLESLADAMDLTVRGKKYWLLHGGVPTAPAGLPLEDAVPWFAKNRRGELRSFRHPLHHAAPDYGRLVIVGHAPLAEVVIGKNVVGIDTGAGTLENGKLTALVLPELRVLSVPAPG